MTTEPQLIDLLCQEPGRFEPITAFRIAQRSGGDMQISAPVGVSISTLAIDNVEKQKGGISLSTTLATLIGPTGPLPPSFGELAIREARNRSPAFSAFLDLFNSRLVALFADASEKYRFAKLLRWRDITENGYIKSLLSLTGFGTARLIENSSVDQSVLLHYSGILASRVRNSSNLAALLADFSDLPIEIEQFRGRWLDVAAAEQSRIGLANNRLGIDSMAGTAIFDRSSSFRVVVGPVSYKDYLSLRPDSDRIRALYAITRVYAGHALTADFQIILRKEDIPYSQLRGETTQLGWNSWARAGAAKRDSRDTILVPGQHWPEDLQ